MQVSCATCDAMVPGGSLAPACRWRSWDRRFVDSPGMLKMLEARCSGSGAATPKESCCQASAGLAAACGAPRTAEGSGCSAGGHPGMKSTIIHTSLNQSSLRCSESRCGWHWVPRVVSGSECLLHCPPPSASTQCTCKLMAHSRMQVASFGCCRLCSLWWQRRYGHFYGEGGRRCTGARAAAAAQRRVRPSALWLAAVAGVRACAC